MVLGSITLIKSKLLILFWPVAACYLAAQNNDVSRIDSLSRTLLEQKEPFLDHGELLYSDDFNHGLTMWQIEEEKPGRIVAQHGVLDIDVPAGVTIWFKPELKGPLLIEYRANVISKGGPNDRASDLNCFWMATDPSNPDNLFAMPRHGAFAEYNALTTYYVGLGGNGNTTTRFRRYIGSPTERPLLPENNLSEQKFLIQPNQIQTVFLLANGEMIAFYRNSTRIFLFHDSEPYSHGWFGLRTTKSHIEISHLRIYRLAK